MHIRIIAIGLLIIVYSRAAEADESALFLRIRKKMMRAYQSSDLEKFVSVCQKAKQFSISCFPSFWNEKEYETLSNFLLVAYPLSLHEQAFLEAYVRHSGDDINRLRDYTYYADADSVNKVTKVSVLHVAVRYNRVEMVEVLLRCGANPLLKDEEGNTALHHIGRGPFEARPDFEFQIAQLLLNHIITQKHHS